MRASIILRPVVLCLAALVTSRSLSAQGLRALPNPIPNAIPGGASISPDGVWVMYSLNGLLRLAAFDGSSDVALPAGFDPLWSPASDALYARGIGTTMVSRIAVPSLSVTPVGNVVNLQLMLGCDATGAAVFGVRQSAPGVFTAFRLTVATGVVTDLLSHPTLAFAVAVNPAGTVMLAKTSPQIFIEQMVAVSLTTGIPTVLAQHISISECRFADGYRGALCEYYDPFFTSGRRDVVFAPLDASAPPVVISSSNGPPRVDPGAQRMLLEGYAPLAPVTPVVVGTRGGGETYLDAERTLFVLGGSMSANGRVAFTAADFSGPAQVFVAELDRELEAAPERLGGTARIDLPLRAGESGAILLSLSAPHALSVPGFAGRLFLGGSLLILGSGVGNGTSPLTAAFPIPNDDQLNGYPLYLQGVRIDPNLNRNELTRLMLLSVPWPR